MDADKTVEVVYALEKRTLTVAIDGSGAGTVESTPTGIDCEPDCETEYDYGTVVTLSSVPGANSQTAEWAECDNVDGENKCEVTMDEAHNVTATFDLVERSLTVDTDGSGSGSVSCDGGACAAAYPHGTEVALTASADSGSAFVGWSDGGCSGTGSCVVTLEADTTVTATFDEEEEEGDGGGSTPLPPTPPPRCRPASPTPRCATRAS